MAKLLESVGEIYCGLRGHNMLRQFERDRVYLRCASCGHESPGWTLSEQRPKVSVPGDIRRFALRPRLVDIRRVA